MQFFYTELFEGPILFLKLDLNLFVPPLLFCLSFLYPSFVHSNIFFNAKKALLLIFFHSFILNLCF